MEDIAVIGMSCKFPGAENLDEYWDLILNGRDSICKVPEERWKSCSPEYKNTCGGFLKSPIDEFDAKFFGISPREAEFIDPQQRILLEMTWTALENAGINPLDLKESKTGVFMGLWRNDYAKLYHGLAGVNDLRDYLGNSYAASSARISYFLGLTGSNVATDSGCSSSMMSIHLACQSLKLGESSLAIAGGINLLTNPFNKMTMEHVLAPDGRCKTFDESADGFGRAEGCGILILKKHSDAIRDSDKILALIKGSGVSQEGTSSSFGTPSKKSQVLAIQRAFESCNLNPLEVDYVEAHGTGTIKGDPIEMSAIGKMYGNGRKDPLIIGSVKTNIGHAEAAAGVAGIIKVILAMNRGIIPPHRNLSKLNPLIDLDSIPCVIPSSPIPWENLKRKSRIAGVSSFGISGTNVHLLLQEAMQLNNETKRLDLLVRPTHVLTLSAKTQEALDHLVKEYISTLATKPEKSLRDICFSANTGRGHFTHKLAVYDSTIAGIVNKLQKRTYKTNTDAIQKHKVAFLFPGQGSQYGQMGKTLYETQPVFKNALDYISGIFENNVGRSLLSIIFQEPESQHLHESLYSQISIFCIEYALLELWKSFGITPDLVIGHSLGEFCAAFAAGALSIEELSTLLYVRTRLISNLSNGGMIAIKCGLEKFQVLFKDFLENPDNGWVDVACVNSPDQIVISAKMDTISKLEIACRDLGLKTVTLASEHAYHSRDMDPILAEYESVAKSLNYRSLNCQYISGVSGCLLDSSKMNSHYWVDHCRYSVNFEKAIETAVKENCSIFIEIGPQPVLLGLGMQNAPDDNIRWLPSLKRKENNWTTILDSLCEYYVAGNDVDWKGFDHAYNREKVSLPNYPFQRQRFWFDLKPKRDVGINGGSLVHPLLGKGLQSTISQNIFQNTFCLKRLPYLADHNVAHRAILPTSGMLEMFIVAGQLTLQNNKKILEPLTSLVIEDLAINSSFTIDEDVECMSEIVVTPTSSNTFDGYSVKLYKGVFDDQDNIKWEECANAKFLSSTMKIISEQSQLNLEEIKSCCSIKNFDEMYNSLSNLGLTFGKAFKSITNIWQNSAQILAQVDLHDGVDGASVSEYLGHPILIDGMIQLSVFGMKSNMTDLYLPVGVKKYTWIARSQTKTAFIYAKLENDGRIQDIALYGENCQLLAIIEGVSIVRTNIQSFLKSLLSKDVQLPGLYEEIWQNKSGVYSDRFNLPLILKSGGFNKSAMVPINKIVEGTLPLVHSLRKLAYLYVVKAFIQLGWNPKVGKTVDHIQIADNLNIHHRHKGLIFRFLEILAEEKLTVLKSAKNITVPSKWQLINKLPGISAVDSDIAKEKEKISQYKKCLEFLDLLSIFGEKLSFILQGKENPSDFLFPADKIKFSVDNLYDGATVSKANSIIAKYIECVIACVTNNNTPLKNEKLRILEVGAGSGGTLSVLLPILKEDSVPYNYTYTDISSGSLTTAKEQFQEFSQNITYKQLNIENDPLLQGFVPEQFDIIIASNILYATRDLKESVVHCRRLLAPGGSLVINETFIPDRTHDIIFGVLDEYYRFSDFNLRPYHTVIESKNWCNLLKDSGFEDTVCYESGTGKGVIVAHAKKSLDSHETTCDHKNKRVWVIISDGKDLLKSLDKNFGYLNRKTYRLTSNDLVNKFSNLTKDLLKKQYFMEGIIYLRNECEDKNQIVNGVVDILKMAQFILTQKFAIMTKLVLVTQGAVLVGDQTSSALPSNALYSGFFKALKNENPDMKVMCIDLDAVEKDVKILSKQIIQESFSNEGMMETQVAIRNGERLVVRLKNLEDGQPTLALPKSPRFSICLPESRSYVDLKYSADQKRLLTENEVEVAVKATGLNFKDVMIILKPNGVFSDINAIGLEFSGIISSLGSNVSKFKIGESVFGLAGGACGLASHVVVKEHLIATKPDKITHYEAAALPVVFCTCLYSLHKIAKLTKYDTVLIHAATGGVGLSAIQICQIIGAKIVTTAGSRRKRAYLRSLGIEHVFDSRSTSYGERIKAAVGSVNVVLNSLTGPNFKETTLSVCDKNARFIELGAVNIWREDDVRSLRPDISYSILDFAEMSYGVMHEMISTIAQNINSGIYQPLPIVQFDGRQCRDAFEYFQKTKHIGKIVLSTPSTINVDDKLTHKCMLFSEGGTYLITGGLGGIGMEVTKFMAEYGAKNIVLVNRSPPKESALKTILSLKEKSINVLTFQCDVGNFADCQKLFKALKDAHLMLPPLKGIIHMAAGLAEAMIPNQNHEMFETTYHAKVIGAWNLHNLTMSYNLEHFIMFSSVTSIFSSMGLSGYSSANAYLDSLAEYRYSLGLPATSINWGAWSDVGLVANKTMGKEGIYGIIPFSPAQGILALKNVLRRNLLRAAVVNIDTDSLLEYFPQKKRYVEKIHGFNPDGESKNSSNLIDSDTFYKEIDKISSDQDKVYDFVKMQISNVVKRVLKLSDGDAIDENKNFVDLGMDSLMTIEMKNKLKFILGEHISLALINADDFLSLKSLSHAIVSKIPKKIT